MCKFWVLCKVYDISQYNSRHNSAFGENLITVLEGQDEFRISEKISEFRLTISPSEMTDINTTTLDGDSVTIGELISSLSTVPFMADRRLVIVGGLLNRLGKSSEKNKPEWSDLARLLVGIPDTATLLLVEKESPPTNKFISEILKHVLECFRIDEKVF